MLGVKPQASSHGKTSFAAVALMYSPCLTTFTIAILTFDFARNDNAFAFQFADYYFLR